MYIFQYLPFWAATSVLSSSSTFCLRSQRYYQELESDKNNKGVSDPHENNVSFPRNNKHSVMLSPALISCWSIAESQEEPTPDWNMFANKRDGIAIRSTVTSVSQYLQEHSEDIFDSRCQLRHERVSYYGEEEPDDYRMADITFWKKRKYEYQAEYRFAFQLTCKRSHLQTVIFYNKAYDKPPDYIQKVFIGPDINDKQRKIYSVGVIKANMPTSLIDNWDDCFYPKRQKP